MIDNDDDYKNVIILQKKLMEGQLNLNKATAVLNVVKLWLFDKKSDDVVTLGIKCNGKILFISPNLHQ